MDSATGIRALEELAATQWGLFTAAQASNLGVRGSHCQHLVETGRAERLRRGVYALGGSGLSKHAEVKAAWLTTYPKLTAAERLAKRPYDAVVAGRTAAAVHGLGTFYASPYTISVRERRQTVQDDLRFPLQPIDDRDVVIVDGLPVASPERIVCDLVRSHEDPDSIGTFMRDAALTGYEFDEGRLAQLLAPLAARNGYPRQGGETFARRLLAEHVDGPLSQLSASMAKGILDSYTSSPAYQTALAEMERAASSAAAIAAARKLSPAISDSPYGQLLKISQEVQEKTAAIARPYVEAMSARMPNIIPPVVQNLEVPSMPAMADAISRVVLPPPEVLESLNSTIQSLNSLYELKRHVSEATDGRDADTAGADDSAASKSADSGDAFPEPGGEDHAE